jgi:hypothetical protein
VARLCCALREAYVDRAMCERLERARSRAEAEL